jgi:transporter family protein
MIWFLPALASALLSALAAIGEKTVLQRIRPFPFTFLLAVVILLCSLWIPFCEDISGVSSMTLAVIFAKSVLAALAFLFVMLAISSGELGETLPLLGLSPGCAALGALFILGEYLSAQEWAGLLLMLCGATVIEFRGRSRSRTHPGLPRVRQSTVWVAGALLAYTASGILDRFLVAGGRVAPLVVVFYQHLFFVALYALLPGVWKRGGIPALREGVRTSWAVLLLVGAATVGYRFCQLEALQYAPLGLVLAVKRTSVVFATLFGGRYFRESHRGWKLAGAILIACAGFLIVRGAG